MNQIKILVADVSPSVRDGLCSILDSQEYISVLGTAENGLDAVDKVKLLKPQLVVLGYEMPGMNGIITAQQIQKLDSDIHILLLAVHPGIEEKAVEAGIDACLLKDVERSVLVQTIRDIMNH